jgi:N-acetylglucosaminyl-diphospho-decaprenol L-rhamnosyltransferase
LGELPWSVVTVTYNSAETLRQCWSGPDKPFEWIVVDNNSTDSSAAVAAELGAHTVSLPRNVGFARANNLGVEQATRPYLLFGNPDLVLSLDGLAALRAHLDRHGGFVAPQLLYTNGRPQPNGRGFPYLSARLGNRNVWPFSRMHPEYKMYVAPGSARWVPWATGAALAVRRTDFLRVGRWDERFFLFYEDIDLCLRAWRLGQPVAVLGDVRWVHYWARTNNTLRWTHTHGYELRSAWTFYRTYPEFLVALPWTRRRHAQAAEQAGGPVGGPAHEEATHEPADAA